MVLPSELLSSLSPQVKRGLRVLAKPGAPRRDSGVYSLTDSEGTVLRTGRTSNLSKRAIQHNNDPTLGELTFNVEARTNDYATQRGLEQELYDANPQALRENGGFNKIRPIRLNNPNYDRYMNAAENYGGDGTDLASGPDLGTRC